MRLVTFMTVLSLLSYLVLMVDFYWRRTDLQTAIDPRPDRPIFFVVMLIVLGASVAYQVYRVRCLSRYSETRRL